MKINLATIPREGKEIKEWLSLERLNSRMSEGLDNDIEFVEKPLVEISISLRNFGAEVTGTVSSKYSQPCPRCMETVSSLVKEQLNIILKRKQAAEGEEDSGTIGVLYSEDETFDLEDHIQETLILQTSPFGQKHEGCAGFVMPEKEDDQQFKNNLAEQLKSAGVK